MLRVKQLPNPFKLTNSMRTYSSSNPLSQTLLKSSTAISIRRFSTMGPELKEFEIKLAPIKSHEESSVARQEQCNETNTPLTRPELLKNEYEKLCKEKKALFWEMVSEEIGYNHPNPYRYTDETNLDSIIDRKMNSSFRPKY